MADLYDDGLAQNTDIEYLKGVIQDLLSEKETIRQRVTAVVRDLYLENEELKHRIYELEAKTQDATATKKPSLTDATKKPFFSMRNSTERERDPKMLHPQTISNSNGGGSRVNLTPTGISGSPTAPVVDSKKGTSFKDLKTNFLRKASTLTFKKEKSSSSSNAEDDPEEPGSEQPSEPPSENVSQYGSSPPSNPSSNNLVAPKETVPASHILGSSTSASLEPEIWDDADDLIFVKFDGEATSNMPLVKAATVEKLIERLIPEKYPDPDYVSQFLLTYRSHTVPEKILGWLIEKFKQNIADSSKDAQDDMEKLKDLRRLRITNVVKTWLNRNHSYDLETNEMKRQIEEFIKLIEKSGLKTQASLLMSGLEKLSSKQPEYVPSTQKIPKPLFTPSNSQNLDFLSLEPLEIARQITLIEFDLFKVILPKECLGQAWNKTGKELNSPHVLAMIHWSNRISAIVYTEVLKGTTPRARSDCMKNWIKVAKHCRELNNFNAVFEILAGLQCSALDRMKKTWEKLDRTTKQLHVTLLDETSREKNFQKLRDMLRLTLPPCIPYLGMYLTDLTFVDTGNQDRLFPPQCATNPALKDGLINFAKLRKTAQIIKHLQVFQKTGYSLEVVKEIRHFLNHEQIVTDTDAYKISLAHEPREEPPTK